MASATPTWLDKLLNKLIALAGVQQPQRGTLDFAAGFTVTDDPTNDTLHVTAVGTAGLPGQTNLTLANGSNENVDPASKTVLRIVGPTAAFSIGGFVAPAAPVTLTVINTTAQPMTINHQDVGSTAANRIDCQASGPNLTFPPTHKAVTFVYDTTAGRWQLQSTGVLRPTYLDLVQDFGADPTGSVDATTAFQAALNAAAAGPYHRIVLPAGGTFMISSTLTTNGNATGHGTLSTGLTIEADNARPGSSATLVWAGAAHGTMFAVREAIAGRMRGIAFNGNNIADVGLQLLHIISTDGQDVEDWVFDQCSFGECQLYNTIVGDTNVNGTGAGGSVINTTFRNCRWERSNLGATTTASFFHRSANAVGTLLENPFIDGTNGYPLDGVVVESGTVKVLGGLSQVKRTLHSGHADFYLPTPGGASPQEPGGLFIAGFDSQSDQFLQVDPQSSAAALLPVVVIGCSHSDTFSSGTFSIKWNRGASLATLAVIGGSFGHPINVVSTQPNVYFTGPSLFAPPSGHVAVITGTWTAGAASVGATPWQLTPEQFGADPTGIASSATAFATMFAAKDTLGNAVLQLAPNAIYLLDALVEMGVKPFILRGCGWQSTVVQAVGNAAWSAAGAVTGSLIKCTAAGGLRMTLSANLTNWGYRLEDFALLGAGVGTAVGIWFNGNGFTGARAHISNVFVANCNTGFAYSTFEDCVADRLYVYGCTAGIDILSGSTDLEFYNINVQKNSDGVHVDSATGIHFWGGLVQSNTGVGVHLVPSAGGGSNLSVVSFDGMWFENNTTAGIQFDTTNNHIDYVAIRNCQLDTSPSLAFIGTNAVNVLDIDDGNQIAAFALGANVISGRLSADVAANVTNTHQLATASVIRYPTYVDTTFDFTLPTSTAAFTQAGQWAPSQLGLVNGNAFDVLVDIIASDPSTGAAAAFRGKRATYAVAGGVFVAVGAEIGTIAPDVPAAGEGSTYQIIFAISGGGGFLQAYVYAGNVAHATNWKLRVQIDRV